MSQFRHWKPRREKTYIQSSRWKEQEDMVADLKFHKCEIFLTEWFKLSNPSWEGDLGTEAKNQCMKFLGWYRQKLFSKHSAIGKNWLVNIHRQILFSAHSAGGKARWQIFKIFKLFVASWVMGKNYFQWAEPRAKVISHMLTQRKKCSACTRNLFRNKLANFQKFLIWLSHICCRLSHQQKVFPVGWVISINYLLYARRFLKTSQKSRFYLWWLS